MRVKFNLLNENDKSIAKKTKPNKITSFKLFGSFLFTYFFSVYRAVFLTSIDFDQFTRILTFDTRVLN